ncbi:type I polyketide synthase [Poseidonocella sedimentorum]|uniref:Acyl transferase domain-containing protein n=1 Tax=Poseidonocella sedimentorum TaxID=871652 RepID=A0A1I6DL27_9RHOB|nr:type I polyketide synthase [Poseidonocella sedimentorum]SFR06146.1 Acyl transferase domain-containing protein [Poseidonocella sedimentorum]
MTTKMRVICLAPAAFGIELAEAALRCGATALLDAAVDGTRSWTAADVAHLRARGGALAVRATPDQRDVLGGFEGHPHDVVLTGWQHRPSSALRALMTPGRSIWLEIADAGDLDQIDPSLGISGVLGRGSECGGVSGRESAFILAQRLATGAHPFWIQGAIGPATAAASRLAGAAGVVLDDALIHLAETALPSGVIAKLASLAGTDTAVIETRGSGAVRVACRADLAGAEAFRAAAGGEPPARMGWGDPDDWALPVGQGLDTQAQVARRCGRLGRLVAEVRETAAEAPERALNRRALAPDGPLAAAHGTRLPLVQGPMTRVSDGPAFAAHVAGAGGLPMLALAMMEGGDAAAVLASTAERLGSQPWGVGLLGYLSPDVLEPQIAAVEATRPPFALIAGGRPEQARRLEKQGITTYLHAPTPTLLRQYLEQGARHFVVEGAECGGHIGPLGGFALWGAVVEVLRSLPEALRSDVHVLFAGGIHDARSAAMIAAMAVPIFPARFGLLMGSAYLLTEDATRSGAIGPAFQEAAIACRSTAAIKTGPGHAIRCAPTAFVETFEGERSRLSAEGVTGAALSEALERVVTGRLRLASKGIIREGADLVAAPAETQRQEGLFMMGEAAALMGRTTSIGDLHSAVTEGAIAQLQAATEARTAPARAAPPEPVAIIGIGCIVPGAEDADGLWRLLLDGRSTITEVPDRRWDWRLFYRPDQSPPDPDGIQSKWGGFIDPVAFDPVSYGIPPQVLGSICLPQLLALEATTRALNDAGLTGTRRLEALRARTAVIFGVASAGDVEQMYKLRSGLPLVLEADAQERARLPEWTEETFPGILLNVVAGRVANRFDFGGPNFTVDAACASSLASLDIAIRELHSGRSDLALAGAVEAELSPHAYVAFSNTGALSPTGQARVFDAAADGIVISEGVVVLALKRLGDAIADGDRVYATINGIGGASDGRGLGLTAPKTAGQVRAIDGAHGMAGTSVADLGLYEAHATGTKLGDSTEVETLVKALSQHGNAAQGAPAGTPCIAGSAKSLLGHTRAAAGLVGVTKAALALHHRVLPPHPGVEAPLKGLDDPKGPAALLQVAQPWVQPQGTPATAGVSAFGFGGVNFHAVLQQHDAMAPLGAARWPAEVFTAAGADAGDLVKALTRLRTAAERMDPRAGPAGELRTLSLSSILEAQQQGPTPARAAITARNAGELLSRIDGALARLAGREDGQTVGLTLALAPAEGELAVLFPGQGAQYPQMGAELALYAREVHAALSACRQRAEILPTAAHDPATRASQAAALAATEIAQPALAALSCGMLDFARRLCLAPARYAGHSFGELVALHAAGAMSRDTLVSLAETRGRLMAELGPKDGTMAMIGLAADELRSRLGADSGVVLANLNGPKQTVLSGSRAAIEVACERVRDAGVAVRMLPVSSAFHSPLMAPVQEQFTAALADASILPLGEVEVHANLDGRAYPTAPAEIANRLAGHLEAPVDFIAQVETMWAAGVRSFIEIGPGRTLTGLVGQILGDRPHHALATDGGLEAWLRSFGALWAEGREIDLTALFEDRNVPVLALDAIPAPPADPEWLLDGGRVWRAGTPGHMGAKEFRTADTADPPRDRLAGSDRVSAGDAGTPRDLVYAEYQATMRLFLEQQERVLSGMLGEDGAAFGPDETAATPAEPRAAEPPPGTAPDESAVAATPEDAAPAVPQDREALADHCIRIIAARTGYAERTIGRDLDLAADLGVNSLKRIEIMGDLIESFPAHLTEALQDSSDVLVGATTVARLADAVFDIVSSPAAAAPQAAPATGTTAPDEPAPDGPAKSDAAPHACPRFSARAEEVPLRAEAVIPLDGLCIVTEGPPDLTERVRSELLRQGVRVSVISRADLNDPEALAIRVAVLRMVNGAIGAVVDLFALAEGPHGMDGTEWAAPSPDVAEPCATHPARRLFQLLRLLEEEIDGEVPFRIVAAAPAYPDMMRSAVARRARGGGLHGLLSSVTREHPKIMAKVLDLDVSEDAQLLAGTIALETLVPGGGDEVAYCNGRRFAYTARATPLIRSGAPTDWRIPASGVVLATGGARGITAEICAEVAGPGVHFALVGREPAPDGTAEDHPRAAAIARLEQAGAEVSYHQADVRSPDALGAVIDRLYARHGRIDAVLHGAGVIEDQRFCSKDLASFDRVFATKVASTAVLRAKLRPEALRWVVLFGSVSGRFGNRGQCDYAAANDAMARIGSEMVRAWPDVRVLSIDWGPWSGTGMAGAGVQAMLRREGIRTIPPEAGRAFFADEMTWGTKADSEVVAGQGPWASETDGGLSRLLALSARMLRRHGPAEEDVA